MVDRRILSVNEWIIQHVQKWFPDCLEIFMAQEPASISDSVDPTPPSSLKGRYRQVVQNVAAAAERSGRRAKDVLIVAVTKYAAPEHIRQLIEMGHADFGESRVQNLVKRITPIEEFHERHRTLTSSRKVDIPDRIRWHMIGHLQRNKVRKVIDLVTLIHSVDTLRLAEEIQDAASTREKPVDVLLQVNASFEKTKYGIALPAAAHLVEMIQTMMHVRVRGLMTMAPFTDDEQVIRDTFLRCQDCFDDIRRKSAVGKSFNILSMGMSHDYEIAIECGANLIRVGTAIFGPREETTELEE